MLDLIRVDFEEPRDQKLSDNGISIIKNKTLLAPGVWNGTTYSAEKIIKAFYNTDWENSYANCLVADHRDDEELTQDDKLYKPEGRPLTLRDWLGFVSNTKVDENPNSKEYGFLKGDLNICDSELARKLIDGKAPFGISSYVQFFGEPNRSGEREFKIMNNAVVVKPACKESYINKKLSDDELNIKLEDVSAFERVRKRLGMGVSEFYAIPREPSSSSKLPIFDATHVRNALARLNQVTDVSEEEKTKAKNKIMFAAKKFGIHTSESKNSDLIELKGGNKMEDKKLDETNVEQVDEVIKDETNESVEDSESEEKSEEVKEESEEELVNEIAKNVEKLMNKRKVTPEMAKMQKLESEIASLRDEIKKLSEVKTEVKTEKLSAKPRTKMVSVPKESEFRGIFGKEPSEGVMDAYQKLSSSGLFN